MSGRHEYAPFQDPLTGIYFTEVEIERWGEGRGIPLGDDDDRARVRAVLDGWRRQKAAIREARDREVSCRQTIDTLRRQLLDGRHGLEVARGRMDRELDIVDARLLPGQLPLGGIT